MGSTVPFDAEKVRALYADRDDYDEQFAAAVDDRVDSGWCCPRSAGGDRLAVTPRCDSG